MGELSHQQLIKIQSIVCVIAIQSCKTSGVITYRDFNSDEARKCRPKLARRPAPPLG